MFEIRKATPEDALGITIVNVYTWKTTYTGLIPNELIDTRIAEVKSLSSKRKDEIKNNNDFIIASVENIIIGFCNYGKSRNEAFVDSAEINALYVLDSFQGDGIGRGLLLAAIKELRDKGYLSVIINCLQGNSALEFYKHMGGIVVAKKEDEINGIAITEDVLYIKI